MTNEDMNQLYKDDKQRLGKLQEIANKYGSFRVFSTEKKGDKVIFSKWIDIIEIDPNNVADLQRITHRTMYPFELVLDSDEEDKKDYFIKLIEKIKNQTNCEFYIFDTGSRGYHVHLYFLEEYKEYQRKGLNFENEIKKYNQVLSSLGFDSLKASRQSPIAIEFAQHWKSAKQKKCIFSRGVIYE